MMALPIGSGVRLWFPPRRIVPAGISEAKLSAHVDSELTEKRKELAVRQESPARVNA
jgi:hypothetical protein